MIRRVELVLKTKNNEVKRPTCGFNHRGQGAFYVLGEILSAFMRMN
jgi:hypothetical protein